MRFPKFGCVRTLQAHQLTELKAHLQNNVILDSVFFFFFSMSPVYSLPTAVTSAVP